MGRERGRERRRGAERERETDPPGEHWGNHGSEQFSWVGALKTLKEESRRTESTRVK